MLRLLEWKKIDGITELCITRLSLLILHPVEVPGEHIGGDAGGRAVAEAAESGESSLLAGAETGEARLLVGSLRVLGATAVTRSYIYRSFRSILYE